MEFEITKNIFIDVDKINILKSQVNKVLNKKIENGKILADIELDISYTDTINNECFKSIKFNLDIDVDDILVSDFNLKKTNVYVVDGKGLSIDCNIIIEYDDSKEVEIINIEPVEDFEGVEEIVYESTKVAETNENEIEKIKEELSLDYQNKLADNLNNRENNVSIISSQSSNRDVDFLSFFDSEVAQYYSIKTLECKNESMLNSIAKEYKIPINVLLAGFDRENGKVIFKITK